MLDTAQLFNQALTALERGNRPLAKDRLERILQQRAFDCEAALMLAQMLREDGQAERAESALVTAIKAAESAVPVGDEPKPVDPPAPARAGSGGPADLASRMLPPSREQSITRTEAGGDLVEAYLELADLRLAGGRPADAARACKRALLHKPNSWEALYLLGNAFTDVGAHAEAAKAYREALATNPFEAEIWWNLGLACDALGDAAGAAEAREAHARLSASPSA